MNKKKYVVPRIVRIVILSKPSFLNGSGGTGGVPGGDVPGGQTDYGGGAAREQVLWTSNYTDDIFDDIW